MQKTTLKYTIFILAIVALLSLDSCRPDPIPIKIPKAESKMAVASQVIPNSVMLISLSRTFDALTPTDTNPGNDLLNQILVAHARVTVSYNGKTDTLFKVAPGFYGTITTPLIEDVQYTLNVFDSSSGKSISAQTRLMKRIFLDTAFTQFEMKKGDSLHWLNLTFKDIPGEDYYMVNIYKNTDFIKTGAINPANIFNINNNGDVSTLALSDQTFSNSTHTQKIDISNFRKGDTCTVTISRIDKIYYTYLIQKQRSAQNGLGNFFGEPVNYTTNVNNGYGFFTAHWPDARILILKE